MNIDEFIKLYEYLKEYNEEERETIIKLLYEIRNELVILNDQLDHNATKENKLIDW